MLCFFCFLPDILYNCLLLFPLIISLYLLLYVYIYSLACFYSTRFGYRLYIFLITVIFITVPIWALQQW